jgi:N-dimethylarginine dimethylaminohydrolase
MESVEAVEAIEEVFENEYTSSSASIPESMTIALHFDVGCCAAVAAKLAIGTRKKLPIGSNCERL